MRATDGRPYELKSVPTKTVAILSTDNGAILVQKFCAAPCLPLEGKVSAKPTDEVKFKFVRRSRTPQLFIIHSQAQPALPSCRNHRIKTVSMRLKSVCGDI